MSVMFSDNDRLQLYRLLDVNANRAMEALRTSEEYIRFFLTEPELTAFAREVRHELADCVKRLFPDDRHLRARDTLSDVGAGPLQDDPGQRTDPRDVCRAAFFRLKESIRTLEEYTKTINAELARSFETVRYRVYDLEASVLTFEKKGKEITRDKNK